jgi:hypothetical protein
LFNEQTKTRIFGEKTYHLYKTLYTRDQVEWKENWLRKRGYEFKVFSDNGSFDIYTYPKVNGR